MQNASQSNAPKSVIKSLVRIGGISLYPTAFLARLPVAMSIVAVLTLITLVRGSYVEAGIAAACVGLGSAVMAPLMGVAADRFGQRIVLVVAATVNILSIVAVNLLVSRSADMVLVYACAVVVGMSGPQIGPMMRARWVALFGQHQLTGQKLTRHIQSVMSYESIADELNYVLGPVLVGVLAAGIGPYAPLYAAAAVSVLSTYYFAFHRSARANTDESASGGTKQAPAKELLRPQVLLPLLGMLCIGMYFGSSLASLNVYMGTFDMEASTGVIYGVMGTGSAIFALLLLLLSARFGQGARWVCAGAIMLLAAILMPFSHAIWMMAVVLFIAGIGVGPAIVTISTIGNDVAPRGRSTTTFSLLAAGIILGQAISNAVTSSIAGNHGYAPGFVVTIAVSALLTTTAAIFAWRYGNETS